MKTTQTFDETGMKGIALWIAGPFAIGGGYAWAVRAMAQGVDFPMLAMLLILAGCVASLAAIPMMMIGREFPQEKPRQ